MTAIVEFDPAVADAIRAALGPTAITLPGLDALRSHLDVDFTEDCVVLGPSVDPLAAFQVAENARITRASLGIILVRRRIDTTILQEALRAGVREVVAERDLAGLTEAVARVRDVARLMREAVTTSEGSSGPRRRGTIITIFSAKGGCGKTTLSTNLAALLAASKKGSVALVDLDLAFGDVGIALQLFPTHSIADALPIGAALDGPALRSLMTAHSSGLMALVAPPDPTTAEKITTPLVQRVLEILADDFDYVIVDTPPALEDHVLAAFDLSDTVALLATLDIPALKNLKLTIETLDMLAFPREKCRIVLNRADSKVGLAISEVEKTLRTPIAAQIPSSRDVPAATNRGVPLVTEDPQHPVTQAIRAFAEELTVGHGSQASDEGAEATSGTARRGRLWRRSS